MAKLNASAPQKPTATRSSATQSTPEEALQEPTDRSASDVQVQVMDITTDKGQHATSMRRWKAKGAVKAVLLCLHGFNDYSHAFENLGRYLAPLGVEVLAYDQRGFGNSNQADTWPGVEALVQDFLEILVSVKRRAPDIPVHALGESMGGGVLCAAEACQIERGKGPLPVGSLILSAPAVWSRKNQPWYQQSFVAWLSAMAPQVHLPMQSLGKRVTDNDEVLAELREDPLVKDYCRVSTLSGVMDLMDTAQDAATRIRTRSLLLYGEDDEIIPRSAIDRFWKDLGASDRQFILYPEGWHLLTRDKQALHVMKDIADWVLKGSIPLLTSRNRLIVPQLASARPQRAERISIEL